MKKQVTPIKWVSKEVPVNKIKPTPKNYKIKTDLGRERLHQSLKQFGMAGTVVINTDFVLIDGNSRIREAKEKGEKTIWASMPTRTLTPKEFKEMSAMFDYAVAGEVDTERILQDLGQTEDFRSKWGMLVPKHLLETLGSKAVIPEAVKGGSSKKQTKEEKESLQPTDYLITLSFSEADEATFRKLENKMVAKYKTATTAETVMKALKLALK